MSISRSNMGIDLTQALSMVSQLPQTIQSAQTGIQDVQAGLKTAEDKVTQFAYAHLALSAASVVISFAAFLVLLRKCQNEERQR
jgi:putative exporter of polyketide antibiotics